jgi:hypothetical protein
MYRCFTNRVFSLIASSLLLGITGSAQCSICTKTASQLGKESAEGLNLGIVYLMILPFAIAGYIAFRWWKNEKAGQKG